MIHVRQMQCVAHPPVRWGWGLWVRLCPADVAAHHPPYDATQNAPADQPQGRFDFGPQ